MLALEVHSPVDGKFEVPLFGLEDFHRIAISQAFEGLIDHVGQGGENRIVDAGVEEGQVLLAVRSHLSEDGFQEVLGQFGQPRQIAEGHFGLDHPELRQVSTGIGVFGPEGGAEGIDPG